jgi:lipopolysaccharide/colanic/teichoic acid biosynthesis glycosyltransferase
LQPLNLALRRVEALDRQASMADSQALTADPGSAQTPPAHMLHGSAQPVNHNRAADSNGDVTGAVKEASTSVVASANGRRASDLAIAVAQSSAGIPVRTHLIYDVLHTVLDPVLAAVAVILLALPGALLALIVKLDSPGPVLFRQQRVGKDGELFEILKLRTMQVTAPKYSLKVRSDDSRVTSIGRILRSTGLDELPQLWNVVWGDMRLIGPRPEQPFIADGYAHWEKARLRVRPGITGWWQVHNRTEIPMHLNIEFDLYHIEHRSLWLDSQILLLTLRVLVRGFRRRSNRS